MSTTKRINLLSNGSATRSWFDWPGGSGEFSVEASWGGGTVKLQYKGPNDTAIDAGSDTTLTANGGGIFTLGAGSIRANVATSTAVYAAVKALPY